MSSNTYEVLILSILAEGAIALSVTLSGGALFASGFVAYKILSCCLIQGEHEDRYMKLF